MAIELPQRKETAEVRWFFAEPPFDPSLLFPAAVAGNRRVDWYACPSHEACGIKWREGRLETKLRLRVYSEDEPLTARAHSIDSLEGVLESWTKWSVALASDVAPPDVELLTSTGWVEVIKQRFLRTFETRETTIREVSHRPTFGCDLEWTNLWVGNKPWWTIGLESVGPQHTLPRSVARVLDQAVRPVLGADVLSKIFRRDNSFGYPWWLNRQFASHQNA